MSVSLQNEEKIDLRGPQKAAIILLALGDGTKQIWERLSEDEIREISHTMSGLGNIDAPVVEHLINDFIKQLSGSGGLIGTHDQTQRLLSSILPEDKVDAVMDEIRGPAGRTMWDKLANVNEVVLANYLKNEYPQTVAVVLGKIRPEHAAKVLSALPDDFSTECMLRMLRMEPVQRNILNNIENTLHAEFMSNLARTSNHDSHEQMAEIFNFFDRQTEARFMEALEDKNRDAADKIRSLMFVFDDLSKLDSAGIQTLLRGADKAKLGLALKGTSEELRNLFLSNMSERASKLLKDDMEAMGPVRLKDVDEAQTSIINTARELADTGEIMLADGGGDDELIY